jgi:shikimate dehydrogenase
MTVLNYKYGLIGYPLKNTFSQQYFTQLFTGLELYHHQYDNYPIAEIEQLPALLLEQHLQGFNVTMPFKKTVMKYLHQLAPEAQSCEAVNCVKVEWQGGLTKLTGYNTDVYGFRKSLMPLLKPWHQQALILGTGGASKAVKYVLDGLGIESTLVGRNGMGELSYDEINKPVIRSHQLIIQTTPVGMYPQIDAVMDFPFKYLTDMHLVYDLIYLPEQTLFLNHSKAAGAIVKNGLEMLHLQAHKSWQIWNDTNE